MALNGPLMSLVALSLETQRHKQDSHAACLAHLPARLLWGGGDREARTLSKQVVWDQWTWVGTMTNAGFSFSSCSSSRGQRSCERLALRSYPDKEGKEAGKLFMDPAPWLGFCLLNTFRTGWTPSCWSSAHCSV